MPKAFQEKLLNNYLWALSKEGIRNIEREEPMLSQGIGMYSGVDHCVAKSIRNLTSLETNCGQTSNHTKFKRAFNGRNVQVI
jgi:hypothetical protein